MPANWCNLKQNRGSSINQLLPIHQINNKHNLDFQKNISLLLLISPVHLLTPGVIADHEALGHAVWHRERRYKTTGILILLCLAVSKNDYHSDHITAYKPVGRHSLYQCLFVRIQHCSDRKCVTFCNSVTTILSINTFTTIFKCNTLQFHYQQTRNVLLIISTTKACLSKNCATCITANCHKVWGFTRVAFCLKNDWSHWCWHVLTIIPLYVASLRTLHYPQCKLIT